MASGAIGSQTAVYDKEEMNYDGTLRIVLDDFVNLLPEWQRSAVQMTVMANMTFQEAADTIAVLRGKPTDKKTVWRWAQAGVNQMREWLTGMTWLGAMSKAPVEYVDEMRLDDASS